MTYIPVTAKEELIPGLIQHPYRNGAGAYEGVVIHYTDCLHDTAEGESTYEHSHWQDAFVHYFVDKSEIVQVAPTEFDCWGCGPEGNPRFVQIEMCDAASHAEFDSIIDRTARLAAQILAARNLEVCPAHSSGSGTLWRHSDVTKILGGTDHMDPDDYLARFGYSWDAFVAKVELYYEEIKGTTPVPVKPAPAPAPTPVDVSKLPVLEMGSTGPYVREVQAAVGNCLVDGVYGSGTMNAVKVFQKRYGLVQDGEVGQATWTVIKKLGK